MPRFEPSNAQHCAQLAFHLSRKMKMLNYVPSPDTSRLVSHSAPDGLCPFLGQCKGAGSQKPAVAWALNSIPMAGSSHHCSGPARWRGGMVRAITMETPSHSSGTRGRQSLQAVPLCAQTSGSSIRPLLTGKEASS